MKGQQSYYFTSTNCDIFVSSKTLLLLIWLIAFAQIIVSNINQFSLDNVHQSTSSFGNEPNKQDSSTQANQISASISENAIKDEPPSRGRPFIIFAEAGKKKKEKSEVVVISVTNPSPKGMGHMPYPIFIPSCGGGHGGFGRRK